MRKTKKTEVKKVMKMDACTAVMIAEGVDEASQENQVRAWQYLVDTGLAWQLQGSFGRTAMGLIEAGIIHGGRK